MIRINLLPHREMRRERRKKDFVALSLLTVVAGATLALAVALGINGQIEAQDARNEFIKRENAKLDAQIKEIALLKQQAEEWRTLYLRAQSRNGDLLRQMEQLKLMVELNPSVSTRLLNAPVIGATSDAGGMQLQIRAGTSLGVHQNDVVAVEGVQLFGSVRHASPKTSWIMPITARAQGRIEGLVMIQDGRGVACSLAPAGDGTLRGDVAYDEADPEASRAVAVGQTVRLDDGQWPASAQMLVLGAIESVEPAPDSPLRPVIVVRPLITLERVTEVIVRVSAMAGDAGEGTP